jgi:UDP-N-acetylglucosamine 2-epimerase (non-hydrolysing)
MIDTLLANRDRFRPPDFWADAQLQPGRYLVLTLHRPSNVDDPVRLAQWLETIAAHAQNDPIVFPVHPRTRKTLASLAVHSAIRLVAPQPYLEFNYLVSRARGVVTDSGGITEEATVLGIPCMTLRTTTERPETVTLGTNELLGADPAALPPALARLFAGGWKQGSCPPLWDGHAGPRIVAEILRLLHVPLGQSA